MATVFTNTADELDPVIKKEVNFPGEVSFGARGEDVRRVQEWLNLHGFGVVVDGDFGPATQTAVGQYQEQVGVHASGVTDEETWQSLVAPMSAVLQQSLDQSLPFGDATLLYARLHLDAHPREVGGVNQGPWVRLYMNGAEGPSVLWCAGFVTFAMRQAADSMGAATPVRGSFSCDELVRQGKEALIFVDETVASPEQLTAGSIFLVRKTPSDWTHTGIVEAAGSDTFSTIEGNTNDSGDREGYEVCARTRSYDNKDFLVL